MKRIFSILFVFSLLFVINVKAEGECTSEELNSLKKIAELVELSYDYEIKSMNQDNRKVEYAVFDITATNLNSNIKVIIEDNLLENKYREFKNEGNNSGKLKGFSEGEKVVVTIIGYVDNMCSGKTLLKKTIRLPYYNLYSTEEGCKRYPEFKYCKDFLDNLVDRSTFNKELNKYIDSQKTNEESTETVEKDSGNWELLVIIAGVIIILAVIVLFAMLIAKKKRKNSL